jgi:hypothetical protein
MDEQSFAKQRRGGNDRAKLLTTTIPEIPILAIAIPILAIHL